MRFIISSLFILFHVIIFGCSIKTIDSLFHTVLLSASVDNTIAKDLSGNYTPIDLNNNLLLEKWELENISEINVGFNTLSSLKGIELFSNLTKLVCNTNKIEKLDVRALTKLKSLFCQQNQIISLNVSGLKNLETLGCVSNLLTEIQYQGCENLSKLYCAGNPLTELDLRPLPMIHIINTHQCKLEHIYFNDNLSKNFIKLNAQGNSKNLTICADMFDRFSFIEIDSTAIICYDCSSIEDLASNTNLPVHILPNKTEEVKTNHLSESSKSNIELLKINPDNSPDETQINIFPNPTSDVLNFSKEISNIELFDINGKLILKRTINGLTIGLSELTKGVYYIKLLPIDGGLIETKKVIIH